jgi:hypothetical protein
MLAYCSERASFAFLFATRFAENKGIQRDIFDRVLVLQKLFHIVHIFSDFCNNAINLLLGNGASIGIHTA